ncbi:AtzE family amidohydrolase [Pseudohaliea rubra]|uniref:Asp-tRNAAsn/Glu-tRNAGln amidotransferase A subunit n=1 Tax=Pseudohaliea rubra DSM 19751 TaxID=1265313 RepID=A0A095X0B8_9GAMM|nr:AtzE family amidohydrolase [Pseudohaliea rubra]KGE04334.1 Asp-tRNAAsn/Glu-tRNAGln amidotransferase A subunit [Pseudohaliea rubra DSM 19751]
MTSATAIAGAVRRGEVTAGEVLARTLARIAAGNDTLNAFTAVTAARARAQAGAIDRRIAAGDDPGPLAGVPFAVKNLFDVAGLVTTAGSLINRDNNPAAGDAVLVRRLEAAGAVLVGSLHMGEYAYDFTGENVHDGPCRNPRDPTRMTGGSSSGAGAAVGGGLVPIALGSDTNGSIRVPASLCGVFGLKPTYGRLPRTGTYPFCDSLDHVGPLAATVEDLARTYDTLQGFDSGDPACARRGLAPTLPTLADGLHGLRVARAGGFFGAEDYPLARAAVERVCVALGAAREEPLPGAAAGRAAAYLVTNAEGAALHHIHLRQRAKDFDPDTRDRFLAGALLPADWYLRAQAARRAWRAEMAAVFRHTDLLVAPCTPCAAPPLGTRYLDLAGRRELLRPNLGLFTQPFSCIGLPALSVPLWLPGETLPIGVQLVAAPWREDLCLRAGEVLARSGVAEARPGVV